MKRVLAIIFALAMVLSIVACGQKTEKKEEAATVNYTIAAAAQTVGQNWDAQKTALVEELKTTSNGRFVADVIDAGMQGDSREMVTAIQNGTYDIGILGDMEVDTVIGTLGWAWSPFLVTSYDQADKVYYGGWINEKLKEVMAKSGIIKIGNAECGFRICATMNKEITSMDAFKGVKIRTPGLADVIAFYEKCGAAAVSIAPSEVAMALQQGTCDGLDNSLVNIKNMGALEMCKYLVRTNHVYAGGSIIANADWWNGLSEADQKLVLAACEKVGAEYMKKYRAEEEDMYANFAGSIVVPSDEFMAQFIEIGQQIWEGNKSKWSSDIVEKVDTQLAANIADLKK